MACPNFRNAFCEWLRYLPSSSEIFFVYVYSFGLATALPAMAWKFVLICLDKPKRNGLDTDAI